MLTNPPRESSLVVHSEIKDNISSVTGNVTVIKKRINGHDQDNHINTYFNGKEISTMFDTGSPISTIRCNEATKSNIIEVDQEKTNSRGCENRIDSTETEKEERMELALKIDILPRKPNTEEIRKVLPDLSGSSALSLLEAKEAWERILVKAGVHRDLWGSIVLSKLKGKALLSLQHSVKRDCMFKEICEALDDSFG